MNGKQKITPEHLARKAVVYLRQSSELRRSPRLGPSCSGRADPSRTGSHGNG